MSGGGLPLGAEYERRAPWNEPSTGEEQCPDCNGAGEIYRIMDVRTKEILDVSKSEFDKCAEDEDDAEETGGIYCKYEIELCNACGGRGFIETGWRPRFRRNKMTTKTH